MKKLTAILCVIALMVGAVVANGQGTLEEAKQFIAAGKYAQAEAVLQARIEKNAQDADSYFLWGTCRLKQGSTADDYFLKAIGANPAKYKNQIGNAYMTEGQNFLANGNDKTAARLFDFAIKWDSMLAPKIAQNLFNLGQYELAVKYNSDIADQIASIYFAKGDAVGVEKGLEFYREAKKYSTKRNEEIKEKLLVISRSKDQEKEIQLWRDAAAEFGEIPPDFQICKIGEDDLIFKLTTGECTNWLRPVQGVKTMIRFMSTNPDYLVVYRDGRVFKPSEPKPTDNQDFKIRATKATTVKIEIEEVKSAAQL